MGSVSTLLGGTCFLSERRTHLSFVSNSLWRRPCPSEPCSVNLSLDHGRGPGVSSEQDRRPLARLRFQIILDAWGRELGPPLLHPNSGLDQRGAPLGLAPPSSLQGHALYLVFLISSREWPRAALRKQQGSRSWICFWKAQPQAHQTLPGRHNHSFQTEWR